MACLMCLMCFGTYGFADVSICSDELCDHDHDHDHNHGTSPFVLNAADDSYYLLAAVSYCDYNPTLEVLTVQLEVYSEDVSKVSGGSITITSNSILSGRAPNATGTLFGEVINSTNRTVEKYSSGYRITIDVENSGENNRNPGGLINLTYYVTSQTQKRTTLSLSGSASVRAGSGSTYTNVNLSSASRSQTVYICDHPETEMKVTTAPTCEKAGSQSEICSVCGYVIRSGITMLPTDHTYNYSNPINQSSLGYTAPTCTTTGRGSFKCTVCGKIAYDVVIPMLGHEYGERYLVNGVYKQQCRNCGDVITATNQCSHSTDNYVLSRVLTESTCTTHGQAIYRCPVCAGSETRELPLADHKLGSYTTVVNPTCTTAGVKRATCSVCKESVTEPIPALGHDWSEWEVTKEATCISNGTQRHECARCKATETSPIEKSGHSFGIWITVKSATCKETGLSKRTCSLCGEEETQVIPLVAHTYGEWMTTTPATCVATGIDTHICSVCGHSETRVTAIDPNGHSYGEWTTVSAKTCITDGVKEHTCKYCQKVEREVDASTGHSFGDPSIKGKVTTKTCGICGYVEQTKTVKNGVQKTLASISGSLTVNGSTAARNVLFEIGAMDMDKAAYYQNHQKFDKAYTLRFLVDGKDAAITSDMELSMKIDASLKDYDISVVVLRGNAFYTVGNYSRKGLDVVIPGSELSGVDSIFIVKGEASGPNIVVPIIIAVLTLAIAGGVIYFIMSKNKKQNNSTF